MLADRLAKWLVGKNLRCTLLNLLQASLYFVSTTYIKDQANLANFYFIFTLNIVQSKHIILCLTLSKTTFVLTANHDIYFVNLHNNHNIKLCIINTIKRLTILFDLLSVFYGLILDISWIIITLIGFKQQVPSSLRLYWERTDILHLTEISTSTIIWIMDLMDQMKK